MSSSFKWQALAGLAIMLLAGGLVIGTPAPLPADSHMDTIQSRNLKFSMGVGPRSPWTKAAERFADKVRKRTSGKIKITVFPSGQLSNGNPVTEFDLIQDGTIDITFHSSIILSIVNDRFSLFSLPWIAPTEEELFRIIDGPGQDVWKSIREQGVVPIGGYSTSGYRQLTNNVRPIRTPGDMEGLTFRVPGLELYKEVFKSLGVRTVSTSFGELYGALQQGVVDGQENPISLIEASKFYEVQSHITIWNYSADSIGILVNEDLWKELHPDAQKILRSAAEEAAAWHREAQQRADAEDLETLRKHMDVIELNDEQIQVFRDQMDPVYERFKQKIGADLVNQSIQAARQGM